MFYVSTIDDVIYSMSTHYSTFQVGIKVPFFAIYRSTHIMFKIIYIIYINISFLIYNIYVIFFIS